MLRLFLYCGYNEIIESKNLSKRTETVDTQRANDVPTKLTRCCVRALYIRKDWEHNNCYLTQSMQPITLGYFFGYCSKIQTIGSFLYHTSKNNNYS